MMEFENDSFQENAKYCFLLGSALRNNDANDFVQIYDTIIPKNLLPDQVALIKTEARRISELSESAFSELVTAAPNFSTVPRHSGSTWPDAGDVLRTVHTGSQRSTLSTASYLSDFFEMDNQDTGPGSRSPSGSGGYKPDFSSITRTSRHFTPHRLKSDDVSDHSDSGVFNATQCTETYSEDIEEDIERPGVFDYCFNTAVTTPKSELKYAPGGFDATEEAEDSPVESPRSSEDLGIYQSKSSEDEDELRRYGIMHQSKSRFDRDVAEADEGTELKEMSRDTNMSYEDDSNDQYYTKYRQQSINNMTRISNNVQYDESEEVMDSDEGELQGVIIDRSSNSDIVNLDSVDIHSRLRSDNDHRNFGTFGSRTHGGSGNNRSWLDDNNDSLEQGPGRKSLSSSTPLSAESQDMFKNVNSYTIKSNSHYNRAVDSPINFSSLGNQRSSDNVRIQKTERDRYNDRNPLQHIGRGVDELLKRPTNRGTPINMPRGSPISYPSSETLEASDSTAGKKKKKKKKREEGESGQGLAESDENGNPLDVDSIHRDKRFSKIGPEYPIPYVNQNASTSAGASGTNFSELEGRKAKRKNKKKKEEDKAKKAEEIPGFCGNKNIEDLLDFIECEPGQKKKKAKNGPHTVQGVVLPQQQQVPAPVDVTSNKMVTTSKKKKVSKSGSGKEEKAVSDSGTPPTSNEGSLVAGSETKDSITEAAISDLNHEISAINQTLQQDSSPQDDEGKIMNHKVDEFIFTDYSLEPPPAEEEFKVVAKPKKREKKKAPAAPSVQVSRPFGSNHVASAWGQQKAHSVESASSFDSNKPAAVMAGNQHSMASSKARPTYSRSITPPPAPSAITSTATIASVTASTHDNRPGSASGARDRAFSPSAFPSLPRSVTTRRASTGDAQCARDAAEGNDSETVESDSNQVSSPSEKNPPSISYARIAATGPKLKDTESLPTGPPTTQRERRYSDGEIASAENFPSIQSHSGSQTNKKRSAHSVDKSSSEIIQPSLPRSASSSAALSSASKIGPPAAKSSSTSHISPPFHSSTPSTSSPSMTATHNGPRLAKPNHHTTSTAAVDSSVSKPPRAPSKNAAPNKPNSNLSVIFLGRQFEKESHIDISFGFDTELQNLGGEIGSTPNLAQAPPCNGPKNQVIPLNGLIVSSVHTVPQGGLSFEAMGSQPNNGPSIKDLVGEAPDNQDFPALSCKTSPMREVPPAEPIPCKRPPKELDPNFQSGKFDLDKAVHFLNSEWERVSREASKDPEAVLFYGKSANT